MKLDDDFVLYVAAFVLAVLVLVVLYLHIEERARRRRVENRLSKLAKSVNAEVDRLDRNVQAARRIRHERTGGQPRVDTAGLPRVGTGRQRAVPSTDTRLIPVTDGRGRHAAR